MKLKQIIQVLNAAIPKKDSWVSEQYGPYNIRSTNKDIKKVLYCVTPTHKLIEYFRDMKYDLLISHHPYVMNVPQLIYHTALDCCKGGLNDMWADYLKIESAEHFDKNLGWCGNITPISFQDLLEQVEIFIGSKVKGFTFTDGSLISSVVICTGLGGLVFSEAENTGADCYITGQLNYADPGEFKAIIEVGHTLSEFMGIRLIQSLLPDLQIDGAPLDIDYFGSETSLTYERGVL